MAIIAAGGPAKKGMSALEPYNAYRQRCHLFAPAPNFAFTRSRNR
jgi:hypothetical protein